VDSSVNLKLLIDSVMVFDALGGKISIIHMENRYTLRYLHCHVAANVKCPNLVDVAPNPRVVYPDSSNFQGAHLKF